MKTPEQIADAICLEVCELPDRTSPDDWPEALLVTAEELHAICAALIRQRDREVYEAGQIAMRNRAAQIADDFWGVDTAAGRIQALPLRSK